MNILQHLLDHERGKLRVFAWIAAIALAVALLSNWQARRDVRRLCELTGDHIGSYGHPLTPRQEIDTICSGYDEEPNDPAHDD